MTTKPSLQDLQKSMVVAINGEFEIQDEDDYTAKRQTNLSNGTDNKEVKPIFTPMPPTEAKQRQDPLKSQRPAPLLVRPKSSDNNKRTISNLNNSTSKSWSDDKNKSSVNNKQRPKRY